ncbi:hypothetical protein CLV35_2205 [Motilibacter peucedani]|uniref:Uncharacterized protein n=1 Tax=Motilibacter peucedani TaxID=598650 RepID=A0A420XQZ0_9ACTN|nr:hypothetical protein [Motilibacter peucedani]RKS75728.1 hypothetical protein CLV35_2205 [Motilibacter peucedani]
MSVRSHVVAVLPPEQSYGGPRQDGGRRERPRRRRRAALERSTPPLTELVGAPLPVERRGRLLKQVREQEVLAGALLLDSTEDSITLLTRTPVSHLAHFLLTVLTGGLWLVVWLLMALRRREQRRLLRVDSSGHVWVVEAL